jgi:Ser/Thr protein kinase RdoA (MazF antagonist)
VDDAGEGRRGLRARPTATLLTVLRERYGIAGSQIRDLGGSSNLNLLVADDQTRYVVRVYRPYVTAGRLVAIHHVRRVLGRGGVP